MCPVRLLARAPCLSPLMTGLSSSALVTRIRWFLARPAASLLVLLRRLVSAGSALRALGPFLSALVTRTRWFLARPAASLLVSLRRLVSAGPALRALGPFLSALVTRNHWSCTCPHPSVSSRLCHSSRAPVSPVHFLMTLLGPRAREFHWNSAALVQFHTRG